MKKALSVIALLLIAMMLLAACAPAATPSTPAAEEPKAEAPKDGQPAPEAPAVQSGGGKTLIYWSMWEATEPQGLVIQQAVDAYMAESGNKVDLQFKGRTGLREGLQPALDANTPIDMFDEDIDRINQTFSAYIMDLEELAKANDYEATANAGLIAACREAGGGTLKSIPYQPNLFNFFYNQDLFDAAGVSGVPATWAEFLDACQKVKDSGKIPLTCDDAYITNLIGYHLGRLVGEARVREIVGQGLWAEEPAVLRMAQDFEDLAKKGYISPNLPSNVWPSGQNGELALGEVAMYLNGSWLPNEIKDIAGPDFRWGCFAYPALDGGVNGAETANFGAQVLAINKKSESAAEAFDIIKYITKGKYDALLSQESLGIPADSSNTEWPSVLASVKPVMGNLTTRWTWAVGVESNVDMTPVISENFTKLCGGTMTAQQFVDAMEKASN